MNEKLKNAAVVLLPVAIVAIIMFCIWYLALPAITLQSKGFGWFSAITVTLLAIGLTTVIEAKCWSDTAIHIVWVAAILIIVTVIVVSIISWTCFHATKAASVADVTVSETNISEVFPDLVETENASNLTLVDLDTARMLGDKKIAGLKNSSWYEVSTEYNLVKYNGKYYRLSFLDYGGFYKYRKAKNEGIPGYILVECTPSDGIVTQNATLVELDNPIRYSKGAFWGYDLTRHLRYQYPGYMFDTSFPEIDEEGVPYYVTGVLRPTAAWGVKTIKSFILTNAQTGESTEYWVNEAPDWIDHVFSLGYLTTIAEWHYTLRDGWWNSVTSKTNVWHTTYHYKGAYKNSDDSKYAVFHGYSSTVIDGEVQFYTGLTAANAAESNLGWLLIDTSTGKMTQYAIVGAEESSAQAAVEQLVSAYRYQATFPLPANINGEASYIMCLKGGAGLVQAYAICNVQNYAIAVQAETLPKAIALYLEKLGYVASEPAIDDEPTTTYPQFNPDDIVSVYTIKVNDTTQWYYEMASGELYLVVKVK